MHRKDKGLTMVELMVALAIMAVVLTIAIPIFNAQAPRMRLNGAARKTMGDLVGARMNAVKLNQTMSIAFSAAGYTISSSDGTYTQTINIQAHYPGIAVSAADFDFSSRGTTDDAASHTVTLTNSEGAVKQITVNIAGQIKIN